MRLYWVIGGSALPAPPHPRHAWDDRPELGPLSLDSDDNGSAHLHPRPSRWLPPHDDGAARIFGRPTAYLQPGARGRCDLLSLGKQSLPEIRHLYVRCRDAYASWA